ncbi:MAG: type III polyketide synthase [Phycisphaerales bacterium]|nr:type III polyketide synthase [Phycisphaerales bacterium]
MSIRLLSIGTASPTFGMSQQECASFAVGVTGRQGSAARTTRAMYRLSGIERRGMMIASAPGRQEFYLAEPGAQGPTTAQRLASYLDHAGSLGARACSNALHAAETDPSEITHFVLASCTGFEAPGPDHRIMQLLGLSDDVERTIVGFMGCHAAINSLRVARSLAAAEPSAIVLVCCAEVCSLHFSYAGLPDRDLANALFADGAAAAVVTAADPERRGLELTAFAARLWRQGAADMSWRIGDHGFEMGLSPSVPDHLQACVRPWIEPWLERHSLRVEDIGAWAIHPGGPRIVRAVRDGLALSDEHVAPSLDVLRHHGNMSSPTVLFILDALARANAPRPWVAMAFGPGLAGEVMLLK